jgi:glycosyltransferase involved in cell wall biosynthesis
MYLSIVSSMYNEEKNVASFLYELTNSLKPLLNNIEIITVNNGSTDNTGNLLNRFAFNHKQVKVIHARKPTLGKGYGISIGIKQAVGKYIVLIDGDLQQNPKDITHLLRAMKEKENDYIIGWRKNRNDPMIRLILSKFYNIMVKVLFNLPIWDIGGQPRIFTRESLKKLDIKCKQWLIEVEIPYYLKGMGFKGGYRRVGHRARVSGDSKIDIKQVFIILFDLIKLRFKVFSYV